MIVGNLQQLEIEKGWLPNHMVKLIKQVMEMHPETMTPGRYELGNSHYMNIDESMTEPEENRYFEAHQEYADIQILLVGHELIAYAPLSAMDHMVEANVDKDVYFYEYSGRRTIMPMMHGNYVVFFPGDAHKPLIADRQPEMIKKVVIKVRLNNIT